MGAPYNPPAFPEVPGDFNAYEGRTGMTLRDWFAGQALAATITRGFEVASIGNQSPVEWAANVSYRLADAMLAERAKGATDTEFAEVFSADFDTVPVEEILMGQMADGSCEPMTFWRNWPGWRQAFANGAVGEPIEPVAWRELTAGEKSNLPTKPL
jgi:hypothetical protein